MLLQQGHRSPFELTILIRPTITPSGEKYINTANLDGQSSDRGTSLHATREEVPSETISAATCADLDATKRGLHNTYVEARIAAGTRSRAARAIPSLRRISESDDRTTRVQCGKEKGLQKSEQCGPEPLRSRFFTFPVGLTHFSYLHVAAADHSEYRRERQSSEQQAAVAQCERAVRESVRRQQEGALKSEEAKHEGRPRDSTAILLS